MSKLNVLQMKSELARVHANTCDIEYHIAKKYDEIDKLNDAMKANDIKIKELESKIKELDNE